MGGNGYLNAFFLCCFGSILSAKQRCTYYLDDIIPPTSRSSSITIRSSNGSLLQQTHQLTHSIGDHNLCISLDQNIQLGVFARLWLFACSVEASFRGNGRSSCFKDFGDVGAVSDCPSGFFCKAVSKFSWADERGRCLRGKSFISKVA